EDRLEKGPPYSGRSGGAVGGTPAQGRSAEGSQRHDPDAPEETPSRPAKSKTPPQPRREGTMRLTGFEAIEYAEKQGLLLNKHPDSVIGPRIGLTIAEAEAIASDDAELIWLDVK